MKNNENEHVNEHINVSISYHTLFSVVFIVLLILKLTTDITLNWFWVVFFLWAPLAADIIIGVLMVLIFIVKLLSGKGRKGE